MIRAADYIVVADGQSLNILPTPTTTWLYKLGTVNLPVITTQNVAVGALSWNQLAADNLSGRRNPYAKAALQSCIVLIGGQTDLYLQNDTGATVYADMVSYAQSATAAGYDYVVGTTIPPSTIYNPTQEGRRVDANVLIMADASDAFTISVDLAAVPGLDDPNSACYLDGLHWSSTGTTLVADTLEAPIATLLGIAD